VAASVVLIPNAPLGLITTAVQALAGVLLPSATVFLILPGNDHDVRGPWAVALKVSRGQEVAEGGRCGPVDRRQIGGSACGRRIPQQQHQRYPSAGRQRPQVPGAVDQIEKRVGGPRRQGGCDANSFPSRLNAIVPPTEGTARSLGIRGPAAQVPTRQKR